MKKLLLAGGAGFIGSHLIDRLLKRNDFDMLVVVDSLWTGRAGNVAHIRDQRLVLVRSEVEHFESDFQFDEIFHLASPASPPVYMREPERTISANLIGAMRLVKLLKEGGRICFTSSSEVYGNPLVNPLPETYRGSVDCTGPRSSYDEGKRCTEALLFESNRVRGVDVRVARIFNVYGPRTRADDGRAVSNFIANALSGKPIVVHGDGLQTRSWGYVDDIVDGLERLFWLENFNRVGAVNVGNDREVSVLEIAQYVAGLIPGTIIVHDDPAPQDPSNRRPDLTLCREILPGWSCKVPYEEGLVRTLRWFEANGEIAEIRPPMRSRAGNDRHHLR
ncbi:NAD-dependent epimerase/dehydratase family protein [Mesorhizobium abyssinicae]|uniref:NAD-dependent epimerase/dehydratase family protein n=1 Tax=Mesorhizobium abyssinicae TaxID=1209958 RepID=UPI003398CDD4